ncbi:hypothetical protein G6F51_014307 [Rhizopus arrhizus]|uniref:Tc1-like transposase DDE domain-containing protein n=1 Tax=Rhizopus oryzae TaxID=64495 RepID=A0A9P6XMH3_RHIOR|nr:hypothetical protein G6F51_014307 [Rhizopus arrhizus]
MDIMDTFPDMQGYHIVMDNAPIHVPAMIDPLIEKRSYIPVYLPPYSPELNPIEDFWAIVKSKVKRYALKDTETLSPRVIEGREDASVEHMYHKMHQKNRSMLRALLLGTTCDIILQLHATKVSA